VVLVPCATQSLLGRNDGELDIAGVVNLGRTSEVRSLTGIVGGTRICSNGRADVIFGIGLDAVFGFAVGLIAVFDFLAGLGGGPSGDSLF
jgi:hypothetical protein